MYAISRLDHEFTHREVAFHVGKLEGVKDVLHFAATFIYISLGGQGAVVVDEGPKGGEVTSAGAHQSRCYSRVDC